MKPTLEEQIKAKKEELKELRKQKRKEDERKKKELEEQNKREALNYFQKLLSCIPEENHEDFLRRIDYWGNQIADAYRKQNENVNSPNNQNQSY